jgi:hypothetical protein
MSSAMPQTPVFSLSWPTHESASVSLISVPETPYIHAFAILILLTMAHLPIFIPDFTETELLSDDHFEDIRDRIQGMNWLSTGLVNEITALYPTAADVNPQTEEHEKDSFADNCFLLFPKDRIFASEKQIEQVADMFMDAWWACRKAHDQKKIICHYGLSSKKKKVSTVDPLSQRETLEMRKEQCKCPFKIMYSHQGKRASVKKPGIFYHAKTNRPASLVE